MAQTRAITEGFDLYPAADTPGYGLGSVWSLLGSAPQLVPGRFGGQAVLMPNNFAVYNMAHFFPATNLNAGGAALWLDKNFTGSRSMLVLRSGSNNRFGLRAEVGGFMSVLANNTVLATTSSPVLTVKSWHYLEFETEHNAATGKVRVYLNDFELPELRLDGVNLAGASVDNIYIDGGGANSIMGGAIWDDLYLDIGGMTRVGEGRIYPLPPVSDVATAFAPSVGADNFANVDDIPAQNVTYNSSATVDDQDLFGIAPMPSNPTKIFGVQLTTLAMKDEASTRAIRGLLKSGAAPMEETADIPLALNSPQFARTFYPLDPATGAPFIRPGVEGLNIGYKVSV